MAPKRILVIAGSDSSGGAGLEADQKVIAAHGCYAMTATTALTAQNTLGVQDIHHTPPDFVRKQIDAVCEDVGVDVVKTGMLASAETILIAADAFRRHEINTTVVDPVMVSTSGSQLLPETAISTLIQHLLPCTTILTPNLPEARLLLQTAGLTLSDPQNVEDIVSIAQHIQSLGPKWVLLKGGHLPLTHGRVVSTQDSEKEVVLNVLVGDSGVTIFESPYLQSKNTHGTGCSLASAIACNLAEGMSMVKAVKKANLYVEAGINYVLHTHPLFQILMIDSFDYVVVGGGTAGVVVASRVREYLPDASIALLEAGANAVHHPSVNDVTDPLDWTTHFREGLMVDYTTTSQEHLDDRKIPNPVGRLLSGSSGVNVGMWMRASTADLDVLAERAGNERFRYENLLRYYQRVETHFDKTADKDQYGFDGPIHTVGGRRYPLRNVLQKSAETLGHKYNPKKGDPVGLGDITQCWLATSDTTATRQHSAKVYNLEGVEVFCNAPVARILLDESKRATAVQLISGRRIIATKEIVIACGAHRTPQLLMLSGIGPSDQLIQHGIRQIVDLPAVGQNLSDHNVVTQYYKLKDSSKGLARPFNGTMKPEYGQGLPFDFALFANLPAAEIETHLREDGITTNDWSEQNLLLRPHRSHYLSIAWYYPLLTHATAFPTVQEDGAHISLSAFHMLPLSRGTIKLRSADPGDNPVCNPRYLSTKTDCFILRRAIRENLRLVETEPLASEIEGEVPPTNPRFPALTSASSDEAIDARIKAFAVTIAHPMGTCALGTVLDDEFRVKRMKGLRVCDASVFPEPIAAMPSCTIYALAELCAELIAKEI